MGRRRRRYRDDYDDDDYDYDDDRPRRCRQPKWLWVVNGLLFGIVAAMVGVVIVFALGLYGR